MPFYNLHRLFRNMEFHILVCFRAIFSFRSYISQSAVALVEIDGQEVNHIYTAKIV